MRMLASLAVTMLLVGGCCLQTRRVPPDPTIAKDTASRGDASAPAPAPVAVPPREPLPVFNR